MTNEHLYEIRDYHNTWDSSDWLSRFQNATADHHELRKKVWENTLAIVADGGYCTKSGHCVSLYDVRKHYGYTKFYNSEFFPTKWHQSKPVEITVLPDDCLDIARQWVSQGLNVSVLNMASRKNPGGGVCTGSGTQEGYLFRCSDYFRSLYQYTDYAPLYKITPAAERYPLDQNYGGIYAENITIFRKNEKKGYALLDHPWTVNMIAVPGMNSPKLKYTDGEPRIVSHLAEGVKNKMRTLFRIAIDDGQMKNKIRTIFRIAIDNGQSNLVLGALGCGALHNSPKHVAELFRDVLCEPEFQDAFERICFAVKADHNSHGSKNYNAFYTVLNGFMPKVQKAAKPSYSRNHIRQAAVGRDGYALLDDKGDVFLFNIDNSSKMKLHEFHDIKQIAMGYNHILGLREDGSVVVGEKLTDGRVVIGEKCERLEHAKNISNNWHGGTELYACEAHSAMLLPNGKLLCKDEDGYDCTQYGSIAESWSNIKQAALTFDVPFALTRDGEFIGGGRFYNREMSEYFNIGKPIQQISAFQCYYAQITAAVLYHDKTVRAMYNNENRMEDVSAWTNIRKICCGYGFIAGLTEDGDILISRFNLCNDLHHIVDIAVNFEHLVAITKDGEIIYRCIERQPPNKRIEKYPCFRISK